MKAPSQLFRLAYISIALIAWSNSVAQCNCNHTLSNLKTTSVNIIDASSFPTYKPGDVFCINAGTYAELRLINFHGTAEKPLIFKNCGGKAVIEGITYPGIQFRGSSHIRVTGTGASNINYGIHIAKAKDGVSGVSIQELSTDFEVDHLEISNVGFAGIIAKTDPDCANPATWRENFTMRNLYFHHNYIHDIGGEGFYVGGTFGYETSKKKCDNIERFAHLLENVKISYNIIENTGWDGLQLNLTLVNAEVSNNSIHGYGWKKEFAQNQGISLGSSLVMMYNNKVIQKPEYAVADSYGISMVSPFPGSYIFNNIVVGSGDYGIWTHVRTPTNLMSNLDTKGFYYINNTIVDAGASGMFYNAREGTDPRGELIHVFYNNLIVDPTTVYTEGTFWKKPAEAFIDYNDKPQKDGATLGNNLLSRDKSAIKFANAANLDFNLLTGSQAIDFGRDVSSFGVTFDFNTGSRPNGAGFDAGAYEFGATNSAPVANAGNDVSVAVGATVTLNGSASLDPDGTISQYAWTQVSGPNTPTITNATSAQASVTLTGVGQYEFRLKVTDNNGATAIDQVKFTTSNKAPIAKAGNDISILVGGNATLNGSASSDPDGTISQFAWTFVSGPTTPSISNANTAQASVTLSVAGVYVFKLTVTDNNGSKANDQIQVTVGDIVLGILNRYPNADHIAMVYPNPASIHDKAVVKFNLEKPTDVHLELYSSTGALLTQYPKIERATSETKVNIDLRSAKHSGKLVLLLIKTDSEIAVKTDYTTRVVNP